jgi:potassium channel subfamily K, other eukaryote
MGLPIIFSAIHFFSRSSRRQDDPEKGPQESREEAEGNDDNADDEGEGDGEQDDDDDDAYDPLEDPARRLNRSETTASNTLFSTSVSGTRTGFGSSDNEKPWYRRIKDYILPPEESRASLEKFVPNYRWTPIIAGVVVPFALLLEIPGLTEHWYIRTEGNSVVETRSNSAILDIGLAFSMACGLCANICLVLRFLEIRVKTVTLLTMVFLTIHGAPT